MLGLLSVEGLESEKVNTLKFYWISKKMGYSIFLIITTSVQLTILTYNGIHKLLLRKMGTYIMALLINKWTPKFFLFAFAL